MNPGTSVMPKILLRGSRCSSFSRWEARNPEQPVTRILFIIFSQVALKVALRDQLRPPVAVAEVPVHGEAQPVLEAGPRLPAQGADLPPIQGVAEVMPLAVG